MKTSFIHWFPFSGSTVAGLAAIGLVPPPLRPQWQERPLVFQVGAELMVLDMMAVDPSGRDVGDLNASETVVEDGSPRDQRS